MKKEEKTKDEITVNDLFIKIINLLKYWKQKWKLILSFCLISSLVGCLYAKYNKPDFTAELTFAIDNDKPTIIGSDLMSNLGFDIGGTSEGGLFSKMNMIDLFKSRKMIEKTLLNTVLVDNKTTSLADLYLTINKNTDRKFDHEVFPKNQERKNFTRFQDSILGEIYFELKNNELKINQLNGNSSIFKIELTSKNEVFLKSFLENLPKVVSEDYYEMKNKKTNFKISTLEQLVDSVKRELDFAINVNSKESVLKNNNLETLGLKKQIDIKISAEVLTDLYKKLELSKASINNDLLLIQVIDAPILPLEKNEISIKNGMINGFSIGFLMITLMITINRIITKIYKKTN